MTALSPLKTMLIAATCGTIWRDMRLSGRLHRHGVSGDAPFRLSNHQTSYPYIAQVDKPVTGYLPGLRGLVVVWLPISC